MKIIFLQSEVEADKKSWINAVALEDGELVASCLLAGWNEACPKLDGLGVRSSDRNQGIGTKLVKACIEKCREGGKQSLTLCVHPKNEYGMRLYRKLGFKTFYQGSEKDAEFWMSIPLNQ